MSSRRWWVVVLLVAGCSLDRKVPDTTVITCADGVCPRDYRCNAQLARCLLESEFDDVPPGIEGGTVSLRLFAPPTSPLSDVTALGPGGQATIEFSVTELLGAPPVVVDRPELDCAVSQRSSLSWALTCTAHPGAADGRVELSLELRDVIGNHARAVLTDAPITLDQTPPGAPDVDDATRISLLREPWGSAATAGVPARTVSGAAGAVEGGVRVVATEATGVGVLARTDAAADGSFGPMAVTQDAPSIRAVDAAGNASAARPVKNRSVVVSLYGSVPRSPSSSPHTFTTYGVHGPSVRRTDGTALGEVDLLAPDAGPVHVVGGTAWEADWLDVPTAITGRPGFVTDPFRGRVVRFGGRNNGLTRNFSRVFEHRDTSWHAVIELDEESDGSPPDRVQTAMAWDGFRDELVLFGGLIALPGPQRTAVSDDTWTWSGRSWRSHRVTPSPAARVGHAMAWDQGQGRVVLVGGLDNDGGLLDDTWAWNGNAWVALDAGSFGGGAFEPALTWNAGLRGLVLSGGRDLTTARSSTWFFDGTRWSPLDAGAGPSGNAFGTWDAVRDVDVVVTSTLDTWEFDGRAWARKPNAPSSPSGREVAVAWDPSTTLTVLGGARSFDCAVGCVDSSASTATWDGTRWVDQGQLKPLEPSRLAPLATARDLGGVLALSGDGTAWVRRGGTWFSAIEPTTPDGGHALLTTRLDGGVVFMSENGLVQHVADAGWQPIGPAAPNVNGAATLVEVSGRLWSGNQSGTHWLFDNGAWVSVGAIGTLPTALELPTGEVLLSAAPGPLTPGALYGLFIAPDGGVGRFNTGFATNLLTQWAWDPDRQRVVQFSGLPSISNEAVPTLTELRADAGFVTLDVDDPLQLGGPRARTTGSLAFDPSSHGLVLSPGAQLSGPIDDVWRLTSYDRQPSAVMKVDLLALALPPTAHVTSLRVQVVAGATGDDGALDGAQLHAFRNGRWWPLPGASNAAPVSAPATLTATLSDEADLFRLFASQSALWVAVVPRGVTKVSAAELRTSALEVTVDYRLP